MRFTGVAALALAAILATACKPSEPAEDTPPAPQAEPPAPAGPAAGTLEWAASGDWRPRRDVLRNRFRHPVQTLRFCGLKPGQTVVEVWPGGGWYTQILAPWLKRNGGTYIAALMDPALSDRVRALNQGFMRTFADQDLYGPIQTSILSADSPGIAPPGSADLVLTFRNVHSWMARGMAPKAFADFYKALKPGGILCVVEHRLPDSRQQDPLARSGYVQRAYVKELARAAGFEFEAQSDINANPKDSADHPFGVWTLPPVRRSAAPGAAPEPGFDRARYDAIGESNRMTLRFRKPGAPARESTDGP